MPHVLWELQGEQARRDGIRRPREGDAAAIAVKGSRGRAGTDGKYVVQTLAPDAPGTLTPVAVRAFVADLVNFLDYMAEPAQNKRDAASASSCCSSSACCSSSPTALKHEYWKDVH